MRVTVEYWAHFRSAATVDAEDIEVPRDADVLAVLQCVASRHEAMRSLLFEEGGEVRSGVLVSLGARSVSSDAELTSGDVVRLMPAIAGG